MCVSSHGSHQTGAITVCTIRWVCKNTANKLASCCCADIKHTPTLNRTDTVPYWECNRRVAQMQRRKRRTRVRRLRRGERIASITKANTPTYCCESRLCRGMICCISWVKRSTCQKIPITAAAKPTRNLCRWTAESQSVLGLKCALSSIRKTSLEKTYTLSYRESIGNIN